MENEHVEAEIHTACKNGDWEMFQVLVNDGANIKAVDTIHKNCLHYAAEGFFFFFFNSFNFFLFFF